MKKRPNRNYNYKEYPYYRKNKIDLPIIKTMLPDDMNSYIRLAVMWGWYARELNMTLKECMKRSVDLIKERE